MPTVSSRITGRLLNVCERHCLPASLGTVFREPYIPYLPERWNGTLVLAEAQNMSEKNRDYVAWLRQQDTKGRFRRLGCRDGGKVIDIMPWDDGSLPLAMAAAFPKLPLETFGVSNAVVWSLRADTGTNLNPTDALVTRSVAFWRDILSILQPERIVCAGSVARTVIAQAWDREPLTLRLPSPMNLSRLVGLFGTDDLLGRYPEVAQALDRYPHLRDGRYRQNRIFYACHAVSLAGASGRRSGPR